MVDNEQRADWGMAAIETAARETNVYTQECVATAISDVLAYVAHLCKRAGLDPEAMFADGLRSFEGDAEDGPQCARQFNGERLSFAEFASVRNLYCFNGENGDDPHEVVLSLNVQAAQRLEQMAKRPDGEAVEVTDERTGAKWRVRAADCGSACYCAARAEQIEPEVW